MHKKTIILNLESKDINKIFVFSIIMAFFITCAFLKNFWEMIYILIIIFLSTVYEFIKNKQWIQNIYFKNHFTLTLCLSIMNKEFDNSFGAIYCTLQAGQKNTFSITVLQIHFRPKRILKPINLAFFSVKLPDCREAGNFIANVIENCLIIKM